MKKIILSGALMLVSASAFASTARLLALGMNEVDNDGVYYIQDSRNVFLNPAYANIYADTAVFEYGSTGLNMTTSTTYSVESATTVGQPIAPKAMGGVFKKYDGFVFGTYLGNESNTSSMLRAAATSSASVGNGTTNQSKMLQSSDNQLDLFFAWEGAYKMGLDLIYAGGKDDTRSSKDSAWAIRSGLLGSNWEASLNLSLNSKASSSDAVTPLGQAGLAETVNQEFKGKFGIQTGGSYSITEHSKVFGYVKYFSWEQSDSYTKYSTMKATAVGAGGATKTAFENAGQNGTVKGNFSSYYLGWGDEMPVNNGDKVFVSVAAKQTNVNLEFTNKTQVRHLVIPVTFGYEAKATEWLTVRGSVVQNLYGHKDNKNEGYVNPVAKGLVSNVYGTDGKGTLANSTTVNAGASLTFGSLTIDGLIGATSGARDAASLGTATNKGVLAFDNVMSTVGVNYKF